MKTISDKLRGCAGKCDMSGMPVTAMELHAIADLIDRTCTYEPEETRGYRDEEGFEHETSEPSDGCASFACSECGFVMPRGIGWFDDEPPYRPHFSFCPGCGSRLVPRTLYDRVADAKEDGDER